MIDDDKIIKNAVLDFYKSKIKEICALEILYNNGYTDIFEAKGK